MQGLSSTRVKSLGTRLRHTGRDHPRPQAQARAAHCERRPSLGLGTRMGRDSTTRPFSYPEPFLRAFDRARRGSLAKSITGYHKNMVRGQYPVLELWPIRCQFDMDLARAPRRARSNARKKGSGYENGTRREFSF